MSALAELGAQQNRSLAGMTSLKLGGAADWFLLAQRPEFAVAALRAAQAEGLAITFLGGGSNLLISDRGVAGLVIKAGFARTELTVDGDLATLYAEAGQPFPALARRLARQGWGGLEWAVSVPGTVGGAVVNNAGAFGGSAQDVVLSVDAIDSHGQPRQLTHALLDYRYRHSRLKTAELGTMLVVGARFALRRGDPHALQECVQRFQDQRTRTQPRQQSAGSVFANPPGDYAGRLLEACGLKGASVGRAQLSPQHANFIVNLGGASAADVYALMTLAQQRVWTSQGVWLRPEVQLVGRWEPRERERLERPAAHPESGADDAEAPG